MEDKNFLKIDMSKQQKLSSAANFYMSRSKEELQNILYLAKDVIDMLLKEKCNEIFFKNNIFINKEFYELKIKNVFPIEEKDFLNEKYDMINLKLKHIISMCNKAIEIIEIKKNKKFNQALTRITFPKKNDNFIDLLIKK